MNRRDRRGGRENPVLALVIAGVRFRNPVIAASGTFGYGGEYADLFDVSRLGESVPRGSR